MNKKPERVLRKMYEFKLFNKIYFCLTISSSWLWGHDIEDLSYVYLFAFAIVTDKVINRKIISIVILPLSFKLALIR